MSLLNTLGLSADAIAARHSCIGGSDANTLFSGKDDRILLLWRQKRGEQPGEDLSDNLAVQMGSFTEPLNIAWFEKQTGRTVLTGDAMPACDQGPEPFMRCTLDGFTIDGAVFEAKHTGTRTTDDDLFARYAPQLTHNCLCAGTDRAVLSAFKGNGDWVLFEYALDAAYADALLAVERDFWACVQSGEPPVPLPPPPAPKPVGVKEHDFTGSNEWAANAADYLETILPAARHDDAKKALKAMVPNDASRVAGHGLTINRTKAGALRFATN